MFPIVAVQATKQRQMNIPPPMAPSLRPNEMLIHQYLKRNPYAVAVVEAWRWRLPQAPNKFVSPPNQAPATTATPEWRSVLSRGQSDKVVRMCQRINGNDFDETWYTAADLAQDVLMTLERHSAEIRDLMTYAQGAARKLHANRLKKEYIQGEESMKRLAPLERYHPTDGTFELDPLYDVAGHSAVDDELFDRELTPSERGAAPADPQIRAIADLLYDGQSLEQIGRQFGISGESVRRRIMRFVSKCTGPIDLKASAFLVIVMLTPRQRAFLAAA